MMSALRPRPSVVIGIAVTLLWLACGAWYIENAVGWRALVYLLPQEVAQLAMGLSAPLLVLWLGLFFIGRESARSEQTRDIVTRVEALLASAVRGDASKNRLAETLKQETDALTAASGAATEKLRPLLDALEQKQQGLALVSGKTRDALQGLSAELDGKTSDLSQRSEALKALLLENQAIVGKQSKALDEVREEAELLVASLQESFSGLFEGLGEKVAETAGRGDSLLDELAARQDKLAAELDRLERVGETLSGSVKQEAQDLSRVAEQMAALTTGAVERLQQQEKLLAEGLVRSLADGELLCESLRGESKRLERLSAEMIEQSGAIAGQIDSAGESLAERVTGAAARSVASLGEIATRGENMAQTLASQTRQNIATTTEALGAAGENLSARLEDTGKEAVARIAALQARAGDALRSVEALAEQRVEGLVSQLDRAREALDSQLAGAAAAAESRMAALEKRCQALSVSLGDDSAGQVQALADAVAETKRVLAETFAAAQAEAQDRVAALDARSRALLASLTETGEASAATVEGAVEKAGQALTEQLSDLAGQAEARIGALDTRNQSLLSSLAETGETSAATVEGAVEKAGQALTEQLSDLAGQAEARVAALDARNQGLLSSLAETGETSVAAIEGAVEKAGQALVRQLAELAGQAETRIGALEARCSDLVETLAESGTQPVQVVEAAVVRARSALDDQGRRLAAAGEAAVLKTEEARSAYSQLQAVFAEKDLTIVEQIEATDAALKTRSEAMAATAQSVGAAVEQTLRRLTAEGAQMDQILGATQRSADQLRATIESEAEAAGELQEKLNRTLESLAVRFEAQTKLLAAASEASAASSKTYLEASSSEMEAMRTLQQEAREGLIELQHRAVTGLGELSGSIEQAQRSAQSLDQELRQRTERYEDVMRESYGRSTKFAEAFAGQAEELVRASRQAEEQIEILAKSRTETQRDAFLRSATLLIEDLNTLAIDMTKLLEDDVPEDVWRSYRKGDRSAFARRLLRMRDQFTVPAVERHFREDEGFRVKASRFMSQFEGLLAQASQCDSDQVLNAAFLTADVGKVYLLLSRSLGREQ